MVSRQETARPLLTPGEVMQLPPADELVMVSGLAPIRAKKLRYFEDRNFTSRVLPPPSLDDGDGVYVDRPSPRPDDWGSEVRGLHEALTAAAEAEGAAFDEEAEGGLQQQRHPGLPEEQAQKPIEREQETTPGDDDDADPAADRRAMTSLSNVARAVAMNESKQRGSDILPSFGGDM